MNTSKRRDVIPGELTDYVVLVELAYSVVCSFYLSIVEVVVDNIPTHVSTTI